MSCDKLGRSSSGDCLNVSKKQPDHTKKTIRSRLILFSPLPPKQNGIADYVSEQLPYLAKYFSLVLVIADADPQPDEAILPAGTVVLRLREYLRQRHRLSRFVHLYHLGNNPDHVYMLPVLLHTPGIVVQHDLGLHHLVDLQTLGQGNFEGYTWALWQQYGLRGKILGEQMQKYHWKGDTLCYELKLNGAFIQSAKHVIVHSHFSERHLRSDWPFKPITYIPHHISPLLKRYYPSRRQESRERLGLPTDRVIITSMGFIAKAKQIRATLQVLAGQKSQGVNFCYVLAGGYRPHEYDVLEDIREFGLEDDVIITDFLDEEPFFDHLVAADIIVNLRYPYGGETSGTLTRALGMGRCCLVVDIGAFSEVPDQCAAKIPWSDQFLEDLRRELTVLMQDAEKRQAYELAAQTWVAKTHNIRLTTQAYADVVYKVAETLESSGQLSTVRQYPLLGEFGTSRQCFVSDEALERRLSTCVDLVAKAVTKGAGYLWWKQALVPQYQSGTGLTVVAETNASQPLLQVLFDYPETELKWHLWPSTSRSSDEFLQCKDALFESSRSMLVLLDVQRLVNDPVLVLMGLAWRLALGQELVLSLLWYQQDELPKAFNKASIEECILAAGFEIIQVEDASRDISLNPIHQQSMEWAYRLRKISYTVSRYPSLYYETAGKALTPAVRLIPGCSQRGLI